MQLIAADRKDFECIINSEFYVLRFYCDVNNTSDLVARPMYDGKPHGIFDYIKSHDNDIPDSDFIDMIIEEIYSKKCSGPKTPK